MKIDSPLYEKQTFGRKNSLYLTSKGMLTCGNGKGNKNLAHLQRKIALALTNLDITDPDKLDHLRKNLLQLNGKIDKRNAHIQASWTLWLINFIYSLTVKKISLNPLDTHVKTVLNELKEQRLPITDVSLPPCEDEVLSKTVFYDYAENTLTERLIQQKDLEPKYKVEAGDQTFYLSKVFDDGGLRCIGYVQKGTHVEPRLFYFCPHRHLWRVAPKVTGNYLGQGRFRVYNELNKLWIVVFPFTTNLC
ncbi:MAG: hypothetical protein KDK65_04655, partial [Chlamydiia bacterium]|nr:hypothetical protein [Chlamydiia bacterium]